MSLDRSWQDEWGRTWLADSELDNWSLFADRRVTRFALRRLNTAGRAYGRQLGLLPQRLG